MANIASTITLSLQTVGFNAGLEILGKITDTIGEVTDALIDSQREFDKMNAQLTTIAGSSEKAAGAFMQIQKFAAATPFSVKEVTDSFVQLTNLGLTPSERAMMSYGNTATSMGKSMKQMVEAVADATTGEFERLKEFGIKSKSENDKVTFTFQGTSTTVKKSAKEIEEYLMKLGETKFGDAMKNQAGTLDTAISNLGDAWDRAKLKIMDAGLNELFKTIVADMMTSLNSVVDFMAGWIQQIMPIIKGFAQAIQITFTALGEWSREFFKSFGVDMDSAMTSIGDAISVLPTTLKYYIEQGVGYLAWFVEVVQDKWNKIKTVFSGGDITESILDHNQADKNLKEWQSYILKNHDDTINKLKNKPKIAEVSLGDFKVKGMDSDDGPSAAALKKQKAAAEKAVKEHEQMVQRARDLDMSLDQEYSRLLASMTTNELDKIDKITDAQIQALNDRLTKAKLSGAEEIAEQEKVAKLIVAVRQKAEIDKAKIVRDAQQNMAKFLDESELMIANLEKDKVKQVELSTKAQIKAYEDRYDKEILAAKAAKQDTTKLEQEKAAVVAALEKNKGEQLNRISGSYWDQLSQRVKDQTEYQGTLYDQFNKGMVDMTMSGIDTLSSGFAEMAVNGKASWTDMATTIIKQIEMLIAKMLIMYAVQQLVGMISSVAGVAAGGAGAGTMSSGSSAAAMSSAITPSFQSGVYANGGAFNEGIQFFADGGVVQNTSSFGMANGRMGVMGETGPEAIVPLTRGPDGKLGVSSTGNSTSGVFIGTLNINVESKKDETSEEQARTIAKTLRTEFEQMMDRRITNSRRPGNIMNPTQVQNAF